MTKCRIYVEMVDFEEFYDTTAIQMIKEALLNSVTNHFELRIWSAKSFNGMPWPTLSIVPVAEQEGWQRVAQRINQAHCNNIVIYGSTLHDFGFPVITSLTNINNFVIAQKLQAEESEFGSEVEPFNVVTQATVPAATPAGQ
ncbi:hypothetical protein [Rhodoferax sp. GW822-FHT02A01]|uniref:hypothetical protein n=1 Tax=Rhodoferax sp. GW822-FHT02A01 TaxID=3141537 RepID=UPI00315CD3D7